MNLSEGDDVDSIVESIRKEMESIKETYPNVVFLAKTGYSDVIEIEYFI